MTYEKFEEIIASSKIPRAMEELETLVKKEFQLEDHEVRVDTGYSDRLVLIGESAMGRPIDRYAKLLPKIELYCRGFLDALDVTEYMTTEYLNDR